MAHPVEEGNGAPSFRPLWALMPYLWPKDFGPICGRGWFSLIFMMLGTVATTYSPRIDLGQAVDQPAGGHAHRLCQSAIGLALSLVVAYALARILMQAFGQLRDGIFAKPLYHAMREVAVQTFAHIHTLSLRFHLERKTGGLSRVIDRGIKGIDTLLSFALFSIFPTIFLLLLQSTKL